MFFFHRKHITLDCKRDTTVIFDPSELDMGLLLEARSFDRSNKNWFYGILNTTTKDMQMSHTVSIIGSSQSGLSLRSSTVQAFVREQIEA